MNDFILSQSNVESSFDKFLIYILLIYSTRERNKAIFETSHF